MRTIASGIDARASITGATKTNAPAMAAGRFGSGAFASDSMASPQCEKHSGVGDPFISSHPPAACAAAGAAIGSMPPGHAYADTAICMKSSAAIPARAAKRRSLCVI